MNWVVLCTPPARPQTTGRQEPDVSAHNLRVRWEVQEGFTHAAVNTVLYQVGRLRPSMVLVPCDDEYDPACGAYPSSHDLDFGPWFHQEMITTSIDYFPGTECWLQNGYDIIAVRQNPGGSLRPRSSRSRSNTTLRQMFSLPWNGNLILVKRGSRDRSRAVNITRHELTLINALVERWIQLEVERDGS